MATTKQRIAITADRDMGEALKLAARHDNVPIASKAAELLRFALDIEEDLYFGKIVEERMKEKNIRWIPHAELRKKVLGKR